MHTIFHQVKSLYRNKKILGKTLEKRFSPSFKILSIENIPTGKKHSDAFFNFNSISTIVAFSKKRMSHNTSKLSMFELLFDARI